MDAKIKTQWLTSCRQFGDHDGCCYGGVVMAGVVMTSIVMTKFG
ncbi:hypothetical protein YpUG050454_3101 [Yersinia pestis biovar Antiqua str. UG05-0454]|nr:hypothetical protein YpUG050454_3101 [Yersinia pestis biovar Antiqua str. UG05-0454]